MTVLISESHLFYGCFDSRGNLLKTSLCHSENEKQWKKSELKTMFKTEGIDPKEIATIKIAFCNSDFTIIPTELYIPENQISYLQNLTVIDPGNSVIKTDSCTPYNIIYQCNKRISKSLSKIFRNSFSFHLSTAFLIENISAQENGVFIHFFNENMQVQIFFDQSLYYAGSFQADSDLAKLYYIMYSYQRFELDATTLPLYISGTVDQESYLFELLKEYVREVRLCTCPVFREYEDQMISHPFFALYCLSKCA